jgi:carboxymethylenebutenolidase
MLVRVTETFLNEDLPISIEIFALPEGRHPAIVFLHGANGLTSRSQSFYRFADYLAESGYVIFLVHYFDGTGITWADNQAIRKNFIRWRKVAYDAVCFAAERSNVLTEHIGLLGVSLGATLALSLAAVRPDIGAIAEFFGALPAQAAALMKFMPPTLIVHGGEDKDVPVEEAYKLEQLLKEKGFTYEMKIFPEEGHVFGTEAAQDVARLTVRFFDKYLRPVSRNEDSGGVVENKTP